VRRIDVLSLSVAFAIGLLFGLGLTISHMISPKKILDFLDVAGSWDPSLLLVMASAVTVTFLGYQWALARPAPLLGDCFQVPARADIDVRLVTGATIFGVGWGLTGYCPGPAITALTLGDAETLAFVLAMVMGMLAYHYAGALGRKALRTA